jgi:hypothetical protein
MDKFWNGDGFLMKQYALIENNIVINTLVADESFISAQSGEWIEYDDSRPAYIGTELVGGFLVSPQPFPSWTLDGNHDWQPPVARPAEGMYAWNEELMQWAEIL